MLFYKIDLGLGGFLMQHILHSFNWLHSFALSCLSLPYQLLQLEITLSRQPYLNHPRALYVVSPLSTDSQQKLSSIQLCQVPSRLSLGAIINRLESRFVPTHCVNFQPLHTFKCQSWQEKLFCCGDLLWKAVLGSSFCDWYFYANNKLFIRCSHQWKLIQEQVQNFIRLISLEMH